MEIEIQIPKKSNYVFMIRNCISSERDNKSFSFYSRNDITEIHETLKNFLENELKQKLSHEIKIDNHKNLLRKHSHRIVLKYYKTNKVKSFSIIFPDYSSTELMNEVLEKFN